MKYRNLIHSGNGFGLQRASDIVKNKVKVGLGDILQQTQVMGRSLDVDLGCPLGSCRSSSGTTVKLSSENTSEIFLQALRDFISERHGELEEGWSVEIKQSVDSCEFYAIYHAPDGKTFGSVYEVACHLGLMSSMQPKARRQGLSHFSGKSYTPKRRKQTKSSVANGFPDNNGSLINDRCKGLLCDRRSPSVITIVNLENSEEAVVEENRGSISSQCYVSLLVIYVYSVLATLISLHVTYVLIPSLNLSFHLLLFSLLIFCTFYCIGRISSSV